MHKTPAMESSFGAFVQLVARLRAPDGCPWDRVQTHNSLKAALLEEAWEVIGAIEQGDADGLQEELGDLLIHVVMHAQIAKDEALFDIGDVIDGAADKLVRRHPHVFGDEQATTPEQVKVTWERVKRHEKRDQKGDNSVSHLPALVAALKVQHQDNAPQPAIDPVDLEALFKGPPSETTIGELLYAAAALADQAGVDPELALQKKLLGILNHG